MSQRSISRSNLGCQFGSGRLGLDWGGSGGGVTEPSGGATWPPVELTGAHLQMHRGSAT
jgi:hypothetical protein